MSLKKCMKKIKAATGVKYTAEATGITKTALDNIIKNIRRFGKVSLIGDYSVVSQVNDFTPFTSVNPSFTGWLTLKWKKLGNQVLLTSITAVR